MKQKKKISVLVPAFNEELNVERAHKAIQAVFIKLPNYDYEIIFTDNHSTDRTFEILTKIAENDSRVRVIRFARNYGFQRSLLMAYQSALGDCTILIECDLQDPPELIPEMLELWELGHHVVYGVRKSIPDGPILAATRRLFYRLLNRLSEDELPHGHVGEFRLVDRCIVDELRKVDDISPYLRGLISSMGFSQVGLEYDRNPRIAGDSKFPLKKLISFAVDAIVNHSLVPLRIASLTGLLIAVITFLGAVGYLVGRLVFGQDWPAGFMTTTALQLISIGLNALFLGIIGEYLGRIYVQIKRRPGPIVETSLNNSGSPAEVDVLQPEANQTPHSK